MEELLLLEKELSFKILTHQDLLNIALSILENAQKEYNKAIGIRVIFDNLLIFQYLMDGKKEDMWLKRKQNTVEKWGHSGYSLWLENQTNQTYQDYIHDARYAICGGSFPINVDGRMRGFFCVSGLSHEQDHQLIVDAFYKYDKYKEGK